MPRKHALLIGVNKYPLYKDTHEKVELSGCVNDARLMRSILVDQFKFDEASISELYDEAATYEGITAEMDRLSIDVGADDIVVFYFSGHGRQRNSISPDEGSGVNSTIMPSNSGPPPHPNRDIADDYINAWLGYLAEVTRYITLIFDSCHSGTMTRDVGDGVLRGMEPDNRTPEEMGLESAPAPKRAGQKLGASGWLALSDSYVVISGCADAERSREFNVNSNGEQTRRGALTHYLAQALHSAPPGSTYRDVFEIVQPAVTARFSTQHPQIEGTQDREIFGTREIKPMRYLPLASVDGEKVVLGGGTAHGLPGGSRWVVYAPGTKRTEGAHSLGVVEIRRVGPLTSEGLVTKSSGEITVGARCVEEAPFAGLAPYAIDVSALPDDSRAVLATSIEQSNLLAIAATAASADARVSILGPGELAATNGPAPGIETIQSRSWSVVDLASRLPMPVLAVNEVAVVTKLIHNLETAARYRNTLKLNNSGDSLDVVFNISRHLPTGELQPANGGDFVFEDGDELTFEIINREPLPVWVSLLDFDLTGGVTCIYPPDRACEEIASGGTVSIPPSQLGLNNFEGEQGIETLKLMVASQHADFSWLQQEPLRPAVTPDWQLRQTPEQLAESGTNRGDIGQGPRKECWQSINRPFVLKQRST